MRKKNSKRNSKSSKPSGVKDYIEKEAAQDAEDRNHPLWFVFSKWWTETKQKGKDADWYKDQPTPEEWHRPVYAIEWEAFKAGATYGVELASKAVFESFG
jgi:hypothetical protein